MLLHDSSLLGVQGPGFKKNAFWHVHFSYVVEPTGDAEFVKVVVSKTEAFSQLFCVCHQTLRVPIPQVLFRVDAARQCKHCGLRLLIHVFLESQERLNAPEQIPDRCRSKPSIHRPGFATTLDAPSTRRRFQQNDWRELLERILLDLMATSETADVW